MRKVIAGAFVIFGILCIMGAAGSSDYSTAMGIYYPATRMLEWCIVGITSFCIAEIILKRRNK